MIVKAGDRFPIKWRVNTTLATATVRVLARRPGCAHVVLDSEITDPAVGEITHSLDGTLVPGTYEVEVEVTDGDLVVSYPNDGYAVLKVLADIA